MQNKGAPSWKQIQILPFWLLIIISKESTGHVIYRADIDGVADWIEKILSFPLSF